MSRSCQSAWSSKPASAQVPDLGRDHLHRAAEHRHRGQQRGMTVALHDLVRDRLGHQSEAGECGGLHRGVDVDQRAHRTRELADGAIGECRSESRPGAAELLAPDQALETECDGLGVDTVRPSHHRRAPVTLGERVGRTPQPPHPLEQQCPRLLDLARERGVDQVRTGHAGMHVTRVVADRFRQHAEERDHVVTNLGLDRQHARLVEPGGTARTGGDAGRHLATRLACRHRRQLDLEPPFETARVAPGMAHRRTRVARDHRSLPRGISDSVTLSSVLLPSRSTSSLSTSPTCAP